MAKNENAYKRIPVLAVSNIHKCFGRNEVLKGIDMKVHEGEVLSLIGGNGAGKSTLMKIIMGIYTPDKGVVSIREKEINLNKPSVALAHGIYMVPQEPLVFPNMTVGENILIGFNENTNKLRKRLIQIMDDIGWHLDLDRKASGLSIAEQQLLEILRGILRDAQLLIFDEPTSALTFDEVESLFKIIKDLQAKKIGIIYITHRLAEVFEISTDVAILRDGKVTLEGEIGNFDREMLVKGLLPPDAEENAKVCDTQENKGIDYETVAPVMTVENLCGYGFVDINLDVYPGEILGVAGVVGAGRSEFATTIFGMDTVLKGKVILDGKDITGLKTSKVIKAGLNYVPEDRHRDGLYKISDVRDNTISALLQYKSMGNFFINNKRAEKITQKYIDDFRIKVTGQDQETGSLSGGNQQKVVIGRALSTSPKVVILDEPTRGIDAAARGDVYTIIQKLRSEGVAVVLISSDIEEIVELSDRAVTMYQGRINREFKKCEITEDALMSAAFGVTEGKQVG